MVTPAYGPELPFERIAINEGAHLAVDGRTSRLLRCKIGATIQAPFRPALQALGLGTPRRLRRPRRGALVGGLVIPAINFEVRRQDRHLATTGRIADWARHTRTLAAIVLHRLVGVLLANPTDVLTARAVHGVTR